jgi:long-chain acyl-CoA synthetase
VKDKEDKPYLSSDTLHQGTRCDGRGEVWIRGDAVSSGYYVMEEKTKESFDAEGWFHTGDIAIWDQYGQLKIVDRLKNLIKLKGGEYIAIEAMESTYANSVFVNGRSGGLMCYGNGDMDKPVALVQIDPAQIQNWAQMNGIAETDDIEQLCANAQVIKAVTADMNSQGKGKLGANEALASVGLISGMGDPDQQPPSINAPWTPENNCLTASNKLNRKPIEKAFASILEPLQGKGIRDVTVHATDMAMKI